VSDSVLTSGRLLALFPLVSGYGHRTMASLTDEFDRGADAARVIIDALLAPWGGSQVCIDAYESAIRTASDMHLTVARAVQLEPVRSFAATCAGLTRDIGATQVSAARWFLDA
jgi:hypothetical protein